MKKSRYSEEQVAYTLRLAEAGTPVADVCRQIGIAEATFYLWKKKYGSLGVAEVRELRQMRDENTRLKRLVADLTLDKQILQEVIKKKAEARSPTRAGAVDSRSVPGELPAGLCAGRYLPQYVVLPLEGPGCIGAAHAHPRDRAGPAAIWLRAHMDHAAPRRLAGQQEAGPPALPSGGVAGAVAPATEETAEPAPRRGATGQRAQSVLEHGFCA